MDLFVSGAVLAALVGAVGGLVLGLAARRGRFCALGAIEDHLYGGDDGRLRMWGLAIAVAIVATFASAEAGLIDLTASAYLSGGWNPAGHVVGGVIFGLGMALTGNCGYGSLARLGGGDLRAFVIVLVMGISAYIVMSGPLAQFRVWLFPPDLVETSGPAGFAHYLSSVTGLSPNLVGILVGLALLAYLLGTGGFRTRHRMVLWGTAAGLAITFGWVGSAWVHHQSFGATPVQSYTFGAPLGETILYVMTSSGSTITFAVGSVAGVLAGACLGSISKGHFRWEACEDPRELRRQILGSVMMGFGAVLAVGCTVGQGLSAISVLSFGAPLTLIGIYVGAAAGLRSIILGFNAA